MSRSSDTQLNVRSRYARERAAELVQATGMTATQIVEEALRAYRPAEQGVPGTLVRRGPLLVRLGGRPVTLAEVNQAVDEVRNARGA